MKELIGQYSRENQIEIYILGTRRTDPYSNQLEMMTRMDVNEGWPDNIRFMPIIDWSYRDIWDFIIEADIPVCDLYH